MAEDRCSREHFFECFGHRGAAGHAPENTLRAVAVGLELGATGIEIDVHRVDDELVVIHDDTLERTTNGSGAVAAASLEYLRSLDAGGGQQVPILSEVLDLVVGRATLNIELKGVGTGALVAQQVAHRVALGRCTFDDFIVSSFDHRELCAVLKRESRIPLAPLVYGIPLDLAACGSALNAYAIHLSVEFLSDDIINDAKRRGLKVFVYTVNDRAAVERLRAQGVDGVFTDFPEVVRRL